MGIYDLWRECRSMHQTLQINTGKTQEKNTGKKEVKSNVI